MGGALSQLVRIDSRTFYEQVDFTVMRRVGGCAYALIAVLVLVDTSLSPPDALGAGIGIAAVVVTAVLGLTATGIAWLRPALATPAFLLVMFYALALAVAGATALQPEGGALACVYTLIVVVAASQNPPRRLLPLLVLLLALAVAPLAYRGWDGALAGEIVIEGSLWIALAGLAIAWAAKIREKRAELVEQERAAALAARQDSLTGLPNRRALSEDLERALRRGTPMTLALYDLDGFKFYNDAFGHPAGDALLARLAGRLTETVGRAGRAYRMGGDEFCLLVHGLRAHLPAQAAVALSESGEGFTVGCSYGAITLPADAQTPETALRLADQRLYRDKNGRRTSAGEQISEALLCAMSERHPELALHVGGVAELAERVAEHLELSDEEVIAVRQAAELHDVGKMAIPDAILHKPGPLDDDEWAFMHRHTVIGERILAAAPALRAAAEMVRSSHERWDGGGYPDALAGEAIPLGARIVFVCDAFDAMTTDRPYRAALPTDHALAELASCAGTQFDPAIVRAFEQVLAVDYAGIGSSAASP